jgi:hypothetical protein
MDVLSGISGKLAMQKVPLGWPSMPAANAANLIGL